MDKVKLPTLVNLSIRKEWQKKYLLKRIGEKDIIIPFETRNEILKQLDRNGRFIQIGEYTIMLNSIKSIDPFWSPNNVPPRPKPIFELNGIRVNNGIGEIVNQKEIDEWDKCFGKKQEEANLISE